MRTREIGGAPERIGVSAPDADIFEIDGPSMVPDLKSSDCVVVDRRDTNPVPAGMFAIWDGAARAVLVTNVQLVRDSMPPRVLCIPSNPIYAPYEVVLDGETRIIGRLKYRIARI